MTKTNTSIPERAPDGIVKGKDIDFSFWLGIEGSFEDATPEEIAAVDAMFDNGDGTESAQLQGELDLGDS